VRIEIQSDQLGAVHDLWRSTPAANALSFIFFFTDFGFMSSMPVGRPERRGGDQAGQLVTRDECGRVATPALRP
jgi:hypothetical protein